MFFLKGADFFPHQKVTKKKSEKTPGISLFFPPPKKTHQIPLQGAGALVLSLQQENGKKSWFKLEKGEKKPVGTLLLP